MPEWDEAKRAANRRKHGIDFAEEAMFEWDTALVVEDDHYDYGETRLRAFGFIRGRLHVMVFTPRGRDVRIISLRKAKAREVRWYEEEWRKA
jgi:uncharacterized DUF497 family protein